MKNIAVIGAGITGLAAAYRLSRCHRGHLFEKGGASRRPHETVLIATPHGSVPLDTGFLVHNDRTYPTPGAVVRGARRSHSRLGHVVRGVVPAERPRSRWRRPGRWTASTGASPRVDRPVRQSGQHRDVRSGRSQPLRRLLRGGGSAARAGWAMLVQTITVVDQGFPRYHGRPDRIEKHIFPRANWRRSGRL
jgi:NAD(P)-binding Rossmann-like domain